MLDRLRRTIIVVIADFDSGTAEVMALARFGVRVMAVGLASEPVKERLRRKGIMVTGIVESRDDLPWEAMDRIGGVDAVLFAQNDWQDVREAVFGRELEHAALSGRSMIPILDRNDPDYRFLRSGRQWAAYTLARAWHADHEEAKDFALNTRGYTIETTAAS